MRSLTTATIAALLIALSACSSDDDDDGGAPPSDDAPGDAGVPVPSDTGPATDDDSGDTTPADDQPGDPGFGGQDSGTDTDTDIDTGTDTDTDTDTGTDAVSEAPLINADNYASLVTTALRLTRQVFGGEYRLRTDINDFAQFAPASGGPPVTVDEQIPCELGGTVAKSGTLRAFSYDLDYAFDGCADTPGVVDGDANLVVFSGGQPGGGFTDTLDVTLSGYDTGFGTGTVAVNATFELSDQGLSPRIFAYTIERYESSDESGELVVGGTGSYLDRIFDSQNDVDAEVAAELTLSGDALTDSGASIELTLDPPLRTVGADAVLSGVITLTAAEDGSSAVVAASGESTVADVVLRDGSGAETSRDTRAWTDLF